MRCYECNEEYATLYPHEYLGKKYKIRYIAYVCKSCKDKLRAWA